METKTTEFSFALKPAEHGVGVFAMHDIKAETYLRLFGDETPETKTVFNLKKADEVPDYFKSFCVYHGDMLSCPKDFGRLEIGWYLNHSKTPNAYHKDYHYFALRDIKAGEEVLIDYNTLDEPEEMKEDYYKQK